MSWTILKHELQCVGALGVGTGSGSGVHEEAEERKTSRDSPLQRKVKMEGTHSAGKTDRWTHSGSSYPMLASEWGAWRRM